MYESFLSGVMTGGVLLVVSLVFWCLYTAGYNAGMAKANKILSEALEDHHRRASCRRLPAREKSDEA